MMTRVAALLFLAMTALTPCLASSADQDAQGQTPMLEETPTSEKPVVPLRRLAPDPSRPTQPQSLTGPSAEISEEESPAAADTPKFIAADKWVIAGYNNNEIIYQIFITNQDTRIIRCTTEIHGFYFDNGKKQSIADRQITTVFPNQATQAGTWLDMDQQSGATYSVRCHPLQHSHIALQ